MRRIINIFFLAVTSFYLTSCYTNEEFVGPMNEDILLDISSADSRAESTSTEAFVNHLDIFIFDGESGEAGSMVYYGRYDVNNASQITLNAKRSDFIAHRLYYVYLVANSSYAEADFAALTNFDALIDMKQEDELLHLSGLTVANAPKYFLMDALAEEGAVVLNNGNPADNTVLAATLRRAAAKVVINITAGDKVQFESYTLDQGSEGGLYYVRNLPYDAFILAEAKNDDEIMAKVRNTAKGINEYFSWNPTANNKRVSLVTYVYPNYWNNSSILDHETCVVMNLPLSYTVDGETTPHYNSWYKIPMTADKVFRRNHYYEVNITLNRPGAIAESTPVEINDIYYKVYDWTSQNISVGGEDKPEYLMVNRTEMEMHNTSIDSSTLVFASSSPVTITVKQVEVDGAMVPDIYYIDKFGAKIYVTSTITGSTDGGIQGNITVESPNPENKTVRYFTLVVTNEEGLTKEVQVRQYPLVYISNTLSSFSYRSDFLGDDAEGLGTADHYGSRSSYSRFAVNYDDGSHSYSAGGRKSSGFFVSKFVSSTTTSGTNRGLSDVDYYTASSTGDFNSPYNARMYGIKIMASSGEYILGRPKITNGITDPGADNSLIVSPSFMIASRLGTLTTSLISFSDEEVGVEEPSPYDYGAQNYWGSVYWPSGSDREGYEAAYAIYEAAYNNCYLKVYAEHCKQYVEVYDPDNNSATDNSVHLNDWRLPTAAELKIIYEFQGEEGTSADAIDYLLNAGAYFSASGPVANSKSNMDGISVRCIRDNF